MEIVNQDMDIVFKKYSTAKIDNIKYKVLLEKLEEAKIEMGTIVELFHINTLQEMDVNQWVKCMRKLEVTIACNAGKKDGDV